MIIALLTQSPPGRHWVADLICAFALAIAVVYCSLDLLLPTGISSKPVLAAARACFRHDR
jgi:hypothetical protein